MQTLGTLFLVFGIINCLRPFPPELNSLTVWLMQIPIFFAEVNSAEFVSDPEALASILSNTGLTHQMVSVAHKPSLAQRIPLKGKRACLTSIGVSLHHGQEFCWADLFCVFWLTELKWSSADIQPGTSCFFMQ